MNLDLIISKADLEREEYPILRRLNGARFGLQERINRYSPKPEGERIFSALQNFLMVQAAAYHKLQKDSLETVGMCLSTAFASEVARKQLEHQKETKVYFFENKKVDYTKPFPDPANDITSLYIQCFQDAASTTSMEAITDALFSWAFIGSLSKLEEIHPFDNETTIKATIEGRKYVLDLDNYKKNREQPKKLNIDISHYILPSDAPVESSPAQFIYGHEGVKEEFRKMALISKNKNYFMSLFHPQKLFSNYLLVGPPGTGKTTLVNSLARQCGMSFIRIPCVELGSEFFSKTASNIHEVYRSGRRIMEEGNTAGVIIFLDEIDHISKRRGYGNSSEGDSLITTLNENLDGGSSTPGVITFGATNVEEMIDPAILSRFTKLYVGYPTDDREVTGIHQAIIQKMETYAGKKMFGSIQYEGILSFSHQDERYKSGREIEKILYAAALGKALAGAEKNSFDPVTTENIIAEYKHHPLREAAHPRLGADITVKMK